MGMAYNRPPLKWDKEHTDPIYMSYYRFDTVTSNQGRIIGPAPVIRVCKGCRCSRELCRCDWRNP